METYNGHVRTPNDAIILFEACRLGLLPRVQRRLSEKERQSIRTGSVFVWDEREAGMRRWTDGKSWSASRVSGSFLTYREMEGKRGGNNFVQPVNGPVKDKTSPDAGNMDDGDGEEGPDGYRYKPDGLMKQSFSLTTSTGQHLHLISYYSRSHPTAHPLRQPSNDPQLSSIQIPKGMYPESTIADASNTPAVTRSPMPGAPNYVLSASGPFGRPAPAPAPPPGFIPGYPPYGGYMYPHLPLSPLHTPPGHYPMHYAPVYYPHPAFAHHPQAPPPPPPPPPPHHLGMSSAPPSHWDQRPLRAGIPPPVSRSPPRPPLPLTTTLPPVTQEKPAHESSTNPQSYPMTPGSERASSAQIDPRLDAPRETVLNVQPPPLTSSRSHPEPLPSDAPTTATQAPSITSLVNAAAQASPLPPRAEPDSERKGSSSPGEKRHEAPIQDIPTNKFPFGGDSMALRKLDRAFGIK